MLQRIKGWFKRKQPDYRLVKCYDKDGVRLYKFDNPLRLPTVRRLHLYTALNDAELGITREQIQQFCEMCKEYFNKQQWANMVSAVNVLEAYTTVDYSRSLLYTMTSPVILLEDENPEEMNVEDQHRKKLLFENNKDVQAFFLRMGHILLSSFSNSSIGHIKIEDFLQDRQQERVEKMFLQRLSRNTNRVLSTSSMSKSTASQSEQEKQTKN